MKGGSPFAPSLGMFQGSFESHLHGFRELVSSLLVLLRRKGERESSPTLGVDLSLPPSLSFPSPPLPSPPFFTTSYTLPALPLGSGVEFIALLQDSVDGADGGRVSQVVKVADANGKGTSCLDNLDHSLDSTFSVSTTTPTQVSSFVFFLSFSLMEDGELNFDPAVFFGASQCGDFQISWESSATNPIGLTGASLVLLFLFFYYKG